MRHVPRGAGWCAPSTSDARGWGADGMGKSAGGWEARRSGGRWVRASAWWGRCRRLRRGGVLGVAESDGGVGGGCVIWEWAAAWRGGGRVVVVSDGPVGDEGGVSAAA